MRSVRCQARRTKHGDCPLDRLRIGRKDILEGVRFVELFPLELAHLVERKYVNTLDIAEAGGEIGNLPDAASKDSVIADHVDRLNRQASPVVYSLRDTAAPECRWASRAISEQRTMIFRHHTPITDYGGR